MSSIDFRHYRPADSCNWLWYGNGLTEANVQDAPYGFEYTICRAPVHNAKTWAIVWFRIERVKNWKGVPYRAHVAQKTLQLDYAPFDWQPKLEKPWQPQVAETKADTSAAWLEYIETGKQAPEIAAILPSLGIYGEKKSAA
jgi:hypothetical protein